MPFSRPRRSVRSIEYDWQFGGYTRIQCSLDPGQGRFLERNFHRHLGDSHIPAALPSRCTFTESLQSNANLRWHTGPRFATTKVNPSFNTSQPCRHYLHQLKSQMLPPHVCALFLNGWNLVAESRGCVQAFVESNNRQPTAYLTFIIPIYLAWNIKSTSYGKVLLLVDFRRLSTNRGG